MNSLVLTVILSLLVAASAMGNSVASSTMEFEGALTDNGDGSYSGIIPMVVGGAYDIYAEEGGTAWFGNDPGSGPVWTSQAIGADHDAWPTWNPDTPDWYQYSLNLYVDGSTDKWAVRNHPGATEANPWYDEGFWGTGGKPPAGVPMAGLMDYVYLYAAETDVGAYLTGTGTPEIPGGAAGQGGGAAAWDMDWSWGSEVVPLEHPGFDVDITALGGGVYHVTLAPAAPEDVFVDDGFDASTPGWGVTHFASIQDGIDAVEGSTVHVADGTYTIGTTLNVNKSVTIDGESEGGVILDASGCAGYGMLVTADGVVLRDMTMLPPAVNYPVHASGTGNPPDGYDGLTIEHMTIEGVHQRTAFDIHGYSNVALSYLTAGDATGGNGIQVTGCLTVDMDNIVTHDNAWGSIAIYCSSGSYLNRGSDDVDIDGDSCTLGEGNIYSQDEFGLTNTNVTVAGYEYLVKNDTALPGYDLFQDTLTDAAAVAAAVGAGSYIVEIATGDLVVVSGMSIQDAIDAANPGDTIEVAAGTYLERPVVNKSVTIVGEDEATTIVDAGAGATGGSYGFSISANDVTITDLTLVGDLGLSTPRYGFKPSGVSNFTLTNVTATEFYRTGVDLNGVSNASLTDVVSFDNGGHGVALTDCNGVSLTNTNVSGNGWQGISVQTWGSSYTLGTSGLVFQGTNTFTDPFQLEMGDAANPGVPPAGDAIITYSTDIGDGADVTVQASDFGFAVHGEQDDGPDQVRIWFAPDLATAALLPAVGGPVGHFTGNDMYIESLTDPSQSYVTPGCSIQAAVDAASAGDNVSVLAGTYEEQVEIPKNLTLTGSGAGSTVILSPVTLTEFFTTAADNYPIVYVHDATSVTVEELTVDGAGRGNGNYRFTGVAYHNAGGAILNCEIKDVRDEPISGAQHGLGIYGWADLPTPQVLNIEGCDLYGYQKNGMVLLGEYLTAHVSDCDVTGYGPAPLGLAAQNGIQIGDGAGGSVVGNRISGHAYVPHDWAACGIMPVNVAGNLVVTGNTLSENSESIYSINSSAAVSGNTITATQAGTGVADCWSVIFYNYGGAKGRVPVAQPVDASPMRGRAAHYSIEFNANIMDFDCGDESVGLYVGEYGTGNTLSFAGQDNIITDFDYNMLLEEGTAGQITSAEMTQSTLSTDCFVDSYNLVNSATTTIDATGNWWGHATGPYNDPDNLSGLGAEVAGSVDFDPYRSGNIVCSPDPEYLSVAAPTKTVSVDYLGGGSGLMYGYTVKFTWDGAIASTTAGSVVQGDLLSGGVPGSTFWNCMLTAANEITITCIQYPPEPGVTGPGTMFSVPFTGLSVGTSQIDITIDRIRDKDNNPLSGFFADDGELIVDVSDPVVSNVYITNDDPDVSDTYVKDGDPVTVTADVSDDDPAFDETNIVADLTGFGGGAAVHPDTYSGGVATWTLVGVTCSPANGPVTVTVTATDDMGNWTSGADDITADNIAPTAVTAFDAAPGNEECVLTWANGTDETFLAGVEVRRTSVVDDYPEYPWFVANWPGGLPDSAYPVDEDSGLGVYDGTGAGHTDVVVDRNIYYYQAFCYDGARNYGPAATTARDQATNYWLGDISDYWGHWGYDGEVDQDDILKLSDSYGLSSPTGNDAECDVGPTVHPDYNRLGLPKPDDQVEFEDAMIFAMNYGVVTARVVPFLPEEHNGDVLALTLEERGVAGDVVEVALKLEGNTGEVKGLSASIAYDPSQLEFVSAVLTEDMSSPLADVFFWSGVKGDHVVVDALVLGTDVTIGGSGDVATLTFRTVGDGYALDIESARIRTADNVELDARLGDLESGGDTPLVFRLVQNAPNPFNPVTKVAYHVPRESEVTIRVYDVSGRVVRTLVDGVVEPGRHAAVWDGRNDAGETVGSGIYFCTMEAPEFHDSRKMTLLK